MDNKPKFLMVTSGINKLSKNSKNLNSLDFFDGTMYSSRVHMGHEHLVQDQSQIHSNM